MYKEKYLKYKKKYLDLRQNILTYSMNSDKSFDLSEQSNKKKYLLLKNKNQPNMIGGAPEYVSIDEGTFIFRSAPNITTLSTYPERLANARLCEDTHKFGLYFANKPIISLAMCIEYDKLMELGIFKVTKNIDGIIKGKYAFRDINPERYFKDDGTMIPNVNPLPEENVSHLGCELQLLGPNNTFLLPDHIQDGISCLGSCEIFLSTQNPDHLKNLELVAAFRFNQDIIKTADDLYIYMNENHFPFSLQKYIDDGILIQFI